VARWSWGKPKGRHALGAAVTQLPSSPLARPVAPPHPSTEPAPTAAPWVAGPEPDRYDGDPHQHVPLPRAASEPVWLPPAEPQPGAEPGRLVESIAALLASGEAWASREAAPAVPTPPVARVTVPTEPVAPTPVAPVTVPAAAVAPQPVTEPPVAPPVAALPVLPPPVTVPTVTVPTFTVPVPALPVLPPVTVLVPPVTVLGPTEHVEPVAVQHLDPVVVERVEHVEPVAVEHLEPGPPRFAQVPESPAPAAVSLADLSVLPSAAAGWASPVAPAEPVAASGPLLVPDAPVALVPARAYDPLTDALLVPLEATGPALLASAVELELERFALAGAATAVPSQPSGRVQLGFRDGSTASLAPDSEQAAALEELAQLLNRRD